VLSLVNRTLLFVYMDSPCPLLLFKVATLVYDTQLKTVLLA